MIGLLKIVGVALVVKLVERFIFPIAYIKGCSMEPTYHEGNIVPFHVILNKQKLNIGDVVVLENPWESMYGHRYLIKRIQSFRVEKGKKREVFVLGDNSGNSLDSREFGWVSIDDVKYKALISKPLEVRNEQGF